jgi:iron complex outermembrane receptor protein
MRFSPFLSKLFWCTASGIALVAAVPGARAREAIRYKFDLPAQPLGASLRDVAIITHRNIVAASTLTDGMRAPALSGAYSVEEALSRLLADTGLGTTSVGDTLIIRASADLDVAALSEPANDADIVVTGTRIRGAPIASPVISLDREDIRNAGQVSLGDVVRSIPQSFGGGQNPGLGTNVPASSGVDIGGGSSINLRGLGSDATLTLLNGHRLSYSASRQSVDVSAIPLGAVERIEIVADGASALYGSDAVAGVANIILRRGVDGIETSVLVGGATDGGDFTQQYGAVGGKTWVSGGVLVAYEFGRSTAIESSDRSYTRTRSPGLTLFPELKHQSAIANAHQRLVGNLSVDIDGLYNKRWSSSVFPLNAAGDLSVSGARSASVAESYAVAPTLRLALKDWRVFLTGSYGRDRVDYGVVTTIGGVSASAGSGYYANTAKAVELGGDGTLFSLPGGRAKLALGAGYRVNEFTSFKGKASFQNTARSQGSYYAYGELNLPLISPDQAIALVHRLSASGALRYENYPGVGTVVTPKLGLVYAPMPDLDLKGSWGQSFRAPTLLQQFQPNSVTLVRATSYGGIGLPTGATVLALAGGNADLKPERATSWSLTLDLHPRGLPGVHAELSYFSTRYRDRIVVPVALTSVALSNPIYRDQVILNPSDAAKAAVIAVAGTFVNAAGATYDPTKVVAIVDNANINAGRQSIQGVDLLLRYRAKLGKGAGALTATLNATYLDSSQQLSNGQPVTALAGTLFNPPHVRARAGLGWTGPALTLTGMLNHTGGVRDVRFQPNPRIDGMTTVDLSARYRTGTAMGWLSNLDLSLSVQNLFNAKPAGIATSIFTDTPYDSTNFSPVGRFVSLGITRKW